MVQTPLPPTPKAAPPCTLVIFGAGGDLTKRLLMPALYNLAGMKLLDDRTRILGVDRSDMDVGKWRDDLTATMQSFTTDKTAEFYTEKVDETDWGWVTERLGYLQGDITSEKTFADITAQLEEYAKAQGAGNVIFYLALAARFFAPTIENLGKAGLLADKADAFRRLVIEKPFGHDLASARELDAKILGVMPERNVYRIDHFMGKEMVQNIMALRFANGMLEPVWRREYIDHVQIMADETLGIGTRGSFYDRTGALRDVLQNHLFTVLAMVAMESPGSYAPDAIHAEKAKVIEAIRKMAPEDAVRAQYTAGKVMGEPVVGYLEEKDIKPGSTTESYVAVKLQIDNWRWAGVPFYLRHGKRMAGRRTQVVIQFRQAPIKVFGDAEGELMTPNVLTLKIDPAEEASVRLNLKRPGVLPTLANGDMTFRYQDSFPTPSRDGYETLFYGCMMGDSTLFMRADNIEASWAALQPALDSWAGESGAMPTYAAGSAGPKESDDLLARDGRTWEPFD
jgi:glucose-6-phosphate 1-dehydrogenase